MSDKHDEYDKYYKYRDLLRVMCELGLLSLEEYCGLGGECYKRLEKL